MEKVSWPLERDGSIQCQQLTSEYLEDAINMMEKSFFPHENVCKAVGISKDPKAVAELKQLTRAAAKDGVTVIAIDKTTNKVVGACFNKIQVKGSTYFENFAKSCKQPRAQALIKFMYDVDGMCNLFDLGKADCLMEIMFLATLPEYGGRGIAKKLVEISLNIAKKLSNGINVKRSVDGQQLTLEPAPVMVSAIWTTFITQKIGRHFEFEIAVERNFETFEYEGKSYPSIIGKETPTTTLVYKKLK